MATSEGADTEATDAKDDLAALRAELIVHRISHYRDTLRAYKVLFDGNPVGEVRDGRTSSFLASPGTYVVRMKLLWITSAPLEVELTTDAPVEVTCGPCGGISQAWKLIFLPRAAIFCRPTRDGDDELRDRRGWWRPQPPEGGFAE